MIVDAWMQHRTNAFLHFSAQDTFAPLLRWTGPKFPRRALST